MSWDKGVKLTFEIMTFNEERCIKRCIESINNFADEVIVIDTGSTDNTINIITEFFPNVKVYNHLWKNDFSYIRNLFSQYASNNWIFQIDADEYFNCNDCEEIKKIVCILDNIDVETGLLSRLMELNLDNVPLISEYALRSKEKKTNCMDIYYYELIANHTLIIGNIKNLITKSISEVTQLDDPFSLINSNGDHLFLSWGWGYFFSRNYDLAFMMWRKIISCDIIKKLDNDLLSINGTISKYFNAKQQSTGITDVIIKLRLLGVQPTNPT